MAQRNPTWAEVTRAKHKGMLTGFAICIINLGDKMHFGPDEVADLMGYCMKTGEEIQEGRISLKDIIKTLKEEYNIYIDL